MATQQKGTTAPPRDRAADTARADVVRFWRTIELFNASPVPRLDPERVHAVSADAPLPWEPTHPLRQRAPRRGFTWQHTVFLGVFVMEGVMEVLRRAFPGEGDPFHEVARQESALGAFIVDAFGRLRPASGVLSTCAWATGRAAEQPGSRAEWLDGLQDAQARFAEQLVEELAPDAKPEPNADEAPEDPFDPDAPAGTPITAPMLLGLLSAVALELGVTDVLAPLSVRVRSVEVPVRTAGADDTGQGPDFVNSFLLDDLDKVAARVRTGGHGSALHAYLEDAGDEPPEWTDVREDLDAVFRAVAPDRLPAGRWPDAADHTLGLSQQLAVNTAIEQLQDGAGIVGVNGPPGTGKTTMLRELIAEQVVRRAAVLAELDDPADAFGATHRYSATNGNSRVVRGLNAALTGYEIVIASANNGAVQNVTMEVPARSAIAPEWHAAAADLDLFPELASSLLRVDEDVDGGISPPAWGLIAARLGNSANRKEFTRKFWHGERPGRGRGAATGAPTAAPLREHLWSPDLRAADPETTWKAATTAFRAAADRVEALRAERTAVHEALGGLAAAQRAVGTLKRKKKRTTEVEQETATAVAELAALQATVDNARDSLGDAFPDERWWSDRTHRELHAPWADPEWNTARTELFLAALALHRALLICCHEEFGGNLQAAMDLLAGGPFPPKVPERATLAAWQTLFLVVPVVSTTFASVSRLFSHLGKETLGWLLIDEAGQAAPQQAVGAIWRARRVLAVGDPRQLEPIVSLPIEAQDAFRVHHGVGERWLPAATSVQGLADALTPVGTHIEAEDGLRHWVGLPLVVHRRCEEPMFSIVGRVAYGDLMIPAPLSRPPLLFPATREPLPTSKWLHVPDRGWEGHWSPAEGRQLQLMLEYLRAYEQDMRQVMVVSPFRDVAARLARMRSGYRGLSAGTVHTAQGKEADIVIFLLGGNPAVPRAKGWAAQRPNLVNVAVSRARRRLYVIGDHDAWRPYPFFDTLAELPVQAARV